MKMISIRDDLNEMSSERNLFGATNRHSNEDES